MKFKTTREDYNKAVEETLKGKILDNCCLLAQTIKRITGDDGCTIGCSYALINNQRYYLANDVVEAIAKFDAAFSIVGYDEQGTSKRVFKADGFTEIEFELPIGEEPPHDEIPA